MGSGRPDMTAPRHVRSQMAAVTAAAFAPLDLPTIQSPATLGRGEGVLRLEARERDSASMIRFHDSSMVDRRENLEGVIRAVPDSAVIHARPEGGGQPVIQCGIELPPLRGSVRTVPAPAFHRAHVSDTGISNVPSMSGLRSWTARSLHVPSEA